MCLSAVQDGLVGVAPPGTLSASQASLPVDQSGPGRRVSALVTSLAPFDHSSCAATLCAEVRSDSGSATEYPDEEEGDEQGLSIMPRRGRQLAGTATGLGGLRMRRPAHSVPWAA